MPQAYEVDPSFPDCLQQELQERCAHLTYPMCISILHEEWLNIVVTLITLGLCDAVHNTNGSRDAVGFSKPRLESVAQHVIQFQQGLAWVWFVFATQAQIVSSPK